MSGLSRFSSFRAFTGDTSTLSDGSAVALFIPSARDTLFDGITELSVIPFRWKVDRKAIRMSMRRLKASTQAPEFKLKQMNEFRRAWSALTPRRPALKIGDTPEQRPGA